MSVHSATDSFTDGADLFDQEKYWSTVSTSIEPDPIAMETEFNKPLSERIILMPSGRHSTQEQYRLDDLIVRVPSAAFRQHQINQWQAQKTEADKTHWAWSATAIVSGLTAAAGAIGLAMDKTQVASVLGSAVVALPVLVGAGVITALVSLFFISSASTASDKANEQMSKWGADPVVKIGRERDHAHRQGFPYIYAHNLKLGSQPSYTGRFHPKQVEHEYKMYFEAFCRKLLDQSFNSSKVTWMENFRSANPLSSSMMIYGLGEVPNHLKPVIEDYTRFEAFLNDIRKSYEDLKSQVRATAKERTDGYIKDRNSQLQPYSQARDTAIATAKAERDRILERHPLETDRHNKEARVNYEAIKKALEDDYSLRATPIIRRFDVKIKEVENEKDERIKKLNDQQSQQLANNYKAAHELLVRADAAWKGKQYQAVNFQQYFPYQVPAQAAWYGQPLPIVQPTPVYYPQPQVAYPQYGMQQAAYSQPSSPPVQQPVYQQAYPQQQQAAVYYPAQQGGYYVVQAGG